MTISQHIGFGKSEHITNAKIATLVRSLLQVKCLYKRRVFKMQTIMMDGQFEPIKGDVNNTGMAVNTTSRDDHETVIERHICTIKYRLISVCSTLHLKKVTIRMIIDLIAASVFYSMLPHIMTAYPPPWVPMLSSQV